MNDQVALRTETAVAAPSQPTVLEIIAIAARDASVDVAKMGALLDFKERVDASTAKQAYTAAMAKMAAELPRVRKNGKIDLGRGNPIPYAKWEDMDAAIRPILTKHGFSLSFPSRIENGQEILICIVSHVEGHSERSEAIVTPDKGPGRNDAQARRSGRTYVKKSLAEDMLNIIREGDDDEGMASGFISSEDAGRIHDMLAALELTPKEKQDFYKFIGVAAVEHIQQYDYERVMSALRSKLAKKQAK